DRIVDPTGEMVGQVEDVLVDSDSGRITYVLVLLQRGPFRYGKAAFVEASVPRTAVPWEYFKMDPNAEQLLLLVDRSTLYAAPQLISNPDNLENNWEAPFQAYWQDHQLSHSKATELQ
ncbi:MAG: PRC-barrel domain-containing protein, partial [Candidatus Promineifilaceae bacterium]